ncbi:MAG: nitroreductase family protein [Bryobacterales bacterium]|nr:nitroreductase family protein [Bryobacterales bacterium]
MSHQPLEFERLSPAEQQAALEAFGGRMRTRRSVRAFSPEPVPAELIAGAVGIAGRAPSGANQQPWRFCAVGDSELKRQIREAAEAEERENYEHRFPPEWLQALEPFGTGWQKPYLEAAPWLIVVFRIDYGLEDTAKVKHYYVTESVGIALGFLIAALHVAGLATLVHTPSPMGFLGKLLKRPANERAFALLPVGYPAADATVPSIVKKPLDEILVRY